MMKTSLALLPLAYVLFGCTPTPEVPKAASSNQTLAAGLQVYGANCEGCHQADGYGVSNMQPALVDDDIVAGDPALLIRVVLKGPTTTLPVGRPEYSNTMPAFSRLTDQQIADVLTYIRHDYGHLASAIDAPQVQSIRSQAGL